VRAPADLYESIARLKSLVQKLVYPPVDETLSNAYQAGEHVYIAHYLLNKTRQRDVDPGIVQQQVTLVTSRLALMQVKNIDVKAIDLKVGGVFRHPHRPIGMLTIREVIESEKGVPAGSSFELGYYSKRLVNECTDTPDRELEALESEASRAMKLAEVFGLPPFVPPKLSTSLASQIAYCNVLYEYTDKAREKIVRSKPRF
jgi:hypothetical protein